MDKDFLFQLTRSRGAWHCITPIKMADNTFQLTRSRGAWLHPWNFYAINKTFQLTRSRGAWPFYPYCQNIQAHFNSHAHVERDPFERCPIIKLYISTHTLTWSVTTVKNSTNNTRLFQLTRSRGAWLICSSTTGKRLDFNSHAHVERDSWVHWPILTNLYFNSHAHVERDSTLCIKCGVYIHFNSHAHVERDIAFRQSKWQIIHFNSHAHVERDYIC